MESQYIIHHLNGIAAAITLIEEQSNEIKRALCSLRGYVLYDQDHPQKGGALAQTPTDETDHVGILEFTSQEISKMPKQFRKIFKTDNIRAHVRKRIRGNSVTFEIRFRADGYNISASGVTLENAKANFIRKLQEAQEQAALPAAPTVPTTFDKFATYYFETFRKRKVKESTYKNDCKRLKINILPHFGSIKLKDITPPMCQQLIDDLTASKKGKTAEEVFSLLNQTFKTAIKHNLILHNPLDIVIHEKHEREHGKALSIEEEKILLTTSKEPYRTLFAIGLFTGIRPNEYATVQIVGNMIVARNSKRKGGREELKRIPITPMLRPYITPQTEIYKANEEMLRYHFKKIFGTAHKLYDLRTTFYTRCKMCGIAPPARAEFMGHSSNELDKAYTDLPDEYLIQEGEKLNY